MGTAGSNQNIFLPHIHYLMQHHIINTKDRQFCLLRHHNALTNTARIDSNLFIKDGFVQNKI